MPGGTAWETDDEGEDSNEEEDVVVLDDTLVFKTEHVLTRESSQATIQARVLNGNSYASDLLPPTELPPDFRGRRRRRLISTESTTSVGVDNRASVYSLVSTAGEESVYEDASEGRSSQGGDDLDGDPSQLSRKHSSHALSHQSSSSSLSKRSKHLQPLQLRPGSAGSSPSRELFPSPTFSDQSAHSGSSGNLSLPRSPLSPLPFSPRRSASRTPTTQGHRGSIPYLGTSLPSLSEPLSPSASSPSSITSAHSYPTFSQRRASLAHPFSSSTTTPVSTIIPLRRYSTATAHKSISPISPSSSRASWQNSGTSLTTHPGDRGEGPQPFSRKGSWHPKPLVLTPARSITTPLTSAPSSTSYHHNNRRVSVALSASTTSSSSSQNERRALSPFGGARRSLGYYAKSGENPRDSSTSSSSLGAPVKSHFYIDRHRSTSEDTGLSIASRIVTGDSPDSSLVDLPGGVDDDAKSSNYAHSLTVVHEAGGTSWDLEPDGEESGSRDHSYSEEGEFATSPLSASTGGHPLIELSAPSPSSEGSNRFDLGGTSSFEDSSSLIDEEDTTFEPTSTLPTSVDLEEDRGNDENLTSYSNSLPVFPSRSRAQSSISNLTERYPQSHKTANHHHHHSSLSSSSLTGSRHRARSSADLRGGILELEVNSATKRKGSSTSLVKKESGARSPFEPREARGRVKIDDDLLEALRSAPESVNNGGDSSMTAMGKKGSTLASTDLPAKPNKRMSVAKRFMSSFRSNSKTSGNVATPPSSIPALQNTSSSIIVPPLTPTDSHTSSHRPSPVASQSSFPTSSPQQSNSFPTSRHSSLTQLPPFSQNSSPSMSPSAFDPVAEEPSPSPPISQPLKTHQRSSTHDSGDSSNDDFSPRRVIRPFSPPPGLGGTYKHPPPIVYESSVSSSPEISPLTTASANTFPRSNEKKSKRSSILGKDSWASSTRVFPSNERGMPSPTSLIVAGELLKGPSSPSNPPLSSPITTAPFSAYKPADSSLPSFNPNRRGSKDSQQSVSSSRSTNEANGAHYHHSQSKHVAGSEVETLEVRSQQYGGRKESFGPGRRKRPVPLDLGTQGLTARELIRSQLAER